MEIFLDKFFILWIAVISLLATIWLTKLALIDSVIHREIPSFEQKLSIIGTYVLFLPVVIFLGIVTLVFLINFFTGWVPGQ